MLGEGGQKELAGHAYEVLNYALIKDTQNVGSISGYIKQQDWYTSAQKWMNSDKVKDTDVAAFCTSMRQAIVALNLNSFDAGVVVWAEGTAGNLPKAVTDLMKKDKENCISF